MYALYRVPLVAFVMFNTLEVRARGMLTCCC